MNKQECFIKFKIPVTAECFRLNKERTVTLLSNSLKISWGTLSIHALIHVFRFGLFWLRKLVTSLAYQIYNTMYIIIKDFWITSICNTSLRYFKAIILSTNQSLTVTEPTFKEQVDALSRQMDKCEDRKRLVSQPVFKEFLESNAPTLYKEILDSILSERHGEKRANLQEKRTTALIWQLLYYRYLRVQ